MRTALPLRPNSLKSVSYLLFAASWLGPAHLERSLIRKRRRNRSYGGAMRELAGALIDRLVARLPEQRQPSVPQIARLAMLDVSKPRDRRRCWMESRTVARSRVCHRSVPSARRARSVVAPSMASAELDEAVASEDRGELLAAIEGRRRSGRGRAVRRAPRAPAGRTSGACWRPHCDASCRTAPSRRGCR